MKTLVIILKSIFVPFSAFTFLILGCLACFCSAVIEWFVFREILAIPNSTINADNWAALIVLVLEGSKITLHFYNNAFKRHELHNQIAGIIKKRRLISGVSKALMALSLICSIICIVNVLYNNNDNKIEEALKKNTQECDQYLETGRNSLRDQRKQELDNVPQLYENEFSIIESMESDLQKIVQQILEEPYGNKRDDLMEEAKNIRDKIDNRAASYTDLCDAKREEIEKKYVKLNEELESKYGLYGSERLSENDIKILIQGDNSYLSNFLLAFSKTFWGREYSRSTYFACALIIGVTISVVLELCISISQMLLTISVESFLAILGDIPKPEKGKRIVELIIWLLFSVFVTTAIYLVASIALGNSSINSQNLFSVLLAYCGTIIIINLFSSKKESHTFDILCSQNPTAQTVIDFIRNIVADAIIPAALAFVGYILIGFICDGNFAYGDLNGLAIALGGCFSKTIKFSQCEFWSTT